jgi:hypothetical protein
METFTKESSKKIRLMAKVYISIKMALNMMVIGKMMSKMDLEKKFGMMVLTLKDTSEMGRNMVKEHISGQTTVFIVVNG